MAREIWYRLSTGPACRSDGGGGIDHQMYTVYSDDPLATKEQRIVTPGYHKTAVLLASDVGIVMDMPDATGPEKAAKNEAYKDLMEIALLNNGYAPPSKLWDEVSLLAYTAANDSATTECGRVRDYIAITLAQSYPVDFKL